MLVWLIAIGAVGAAVAMARSLRHAWAATSPAALDAVLAAQPSATVRVAGADADDENVNKVPRAVAAS